MSEIFEKNMQRELKVSINYSDLHFTRANY